MGVHAWTEKVSFDFYYCLLPFLLTKLMDITPPVIKFRVFLTTFVFTNLVQMTNNKFRFSPHKSCPTFCLPHPYSRSNLMRHALVVSPKWQIKCYLASYFQFSDPSMEHNNVVSLLRTMCRDGGKSLALLGTKDISLSYVELGRRVRALSWHLRQNLRVRPGPAIGVCMDRCFDHILSILGVLDAGAGFVPMDPDLPQQRLAYMISDANLNIILTQRKYTLDLENVIYQDEICQVDLLRRPHGAANKVQSGRRNEERDGLGTGSRRLGLHNLHVGFHWRPEGRRSAA